jgi:hypothetical protein
MIVCMKCGYHNNDGVEFCISCRTFLEWDGEKVAPVVAEPVPDDAPVEADRPRPGLFKRIKRRMGIG